MRKLFLLVVVLGGGCLSLWSSILHSGLVLFKFSRQIGSSANGFLWMCIIIITWLQLAPRMLKNWPLLLTEIGWWIKHWNRCIRNALLWNYNFRQHGVNTVWNELPTMFHVRIVTSSMKVPGTNSLTRYRGPRFPTSAKTHPFRSSCFIRWKSVVCDARIFLGRWFFICTSADRTVPTHLEKNVLIKTTN